MGDMGYQSRWGALYLIDREIDQIDSVHSNLEVEDALMSRLEELREVVIVPGVGPGAGAGGVRTRRPAPGRCGAGSEATADLPADGRARGSGGSRTCR